MPSLPGDVPNVTPTSASICRVSCLSKKVRLKDEGCDGMCQVKPKL